MPPPEWTIIQKLSLCFTYFSIVPVFLGRGPPLTVISLDELLSTFLRIVTQALTFPGNTIVSDLLLLLDFITDLWL